MNRAELLAERMARLDEDHQARIRPIRRLGLAAGTALLSAVMLLAVLDGLGAVDAVGVDDAVVTATARGISLEVRHTTVSRPALASPFEITVHRDGGFGDEPVRLSVNADYLLLWDLNVVIPAPFEERSEGDTVQWTFEAPPGDELRIDYEARIEPARQDGASGRVAVVDEDGHEVVFVEFETRLRP